MTAILFEAFRHAAWATRALVTACERLTREQLEQSAPCFGSVLATLNHVVLADADYAAMLTGAVPNWVRTRSEATGLDEIAARADATLAQWESLLALPVDADRELVLDRGTYACPAAVVVIQALHHGAAHREQVRARLAEFGVAAPDVQPWAFADETGRSRRLPGGGRVG